MRLVKLMALPLVAAAGTATYTLIPDGPSGDWSRSSPDLADARQWLTECVMSGGTATVTSQYDGGLVKQWTIDCVENDQ